MQDIRSQNDLVAQQSAFVDNLMAEVGKVIVGQTYMIDGGQASNLYASGDFRERRDHTFGRDYVNVPE